jgi:hypothetical protein
MLDPESQGSILKSFGDWVVATNGLVQKDGSHHIPVSRLWDLWADPAKDKWGWPLLAVQKGWIREGQQDSFNDAFFFAHEQFRAFLPPLSGKPSTHATLEAQAALFKLTK